MFVLQGPTDGSDRGFTLVEVIIALGLGLVLMTVVLRVFLSLWSAVNDSAEATEVAERAAFTLNAVSRWVSRSGARYPTATYENTKLSGWGSDADDAGWQNSLASDLEHLTVWTGLDFCQSPLLAPMPIELTALSIARVADVSCLGSTSAILGSDVLLIERRESCLPSCSGPGFFALLPSCDLLTTNDIRWMRRAEVPAECHPSTQLIRLQRQMIYWRAYTHRWGDGQPALMLKRQSVESSGRWLRADALAGFISEWRLCGLAKNNPDCQLDGRPLDAVRVSLSARSRAHVVRQRRLMVPR